MQGFNKIVIAGHVARDPELRFTPQGTALCQTSIATTEKKKNAAGEYEDRTTWFRLTIFGKSAESFNQYVTKGQTVFVEGRLSLEEYTDRDGNKRSNLNVIVADWKNLERRSAESTESSTSRENHQAPPAGETSSRFDDEDVPF